ncbi:MAG: hypothetical protein ACI9OU_001689 [Candidatus Promineifilaceae bacterium]
MQLSGYRYYSAELGRWLSRDPLGDQAFLELSFSRRFGVSLRDLNSGEISGSATHLASLYLQAERYQVLSVQASCRFVDNAPVDAIDYLGLELSEICCSVTQRKQIEDASRDLKKKHKHWRKKYTGNVKVSKGVLDSVGRLPLDSLTKDVVDMLAIIPDDPACQRAIDAVGNMNCSGIGREGRDCAWNVALSVGSSHSWVIQNHLAQFFTTLGGLCCETKAQKGKEE